MVNRAALLNIKNTVSGPDENTAFPQGHRGCGTPGQLEIDYVLENNLTGLRFDVALTKREREILEFVLAGKTNKEISQELYRTERTVEYHRNRLMRKLGVHTTVELIKRAIAMGIG